VSKKAPKRPRAVRRELERELGRLEGAREKLARLEEGGSPERPIAVASASTVESRALALGCARCEGELRLEEHTAVRADSAPLRLVRARCRSCHALREVWLHIAQPS
jgi:hypothetical protein